MTEILARVGAGAVVIRNKKILLVRLTYGWAKGRWLLPNGGQQPGETLAACAERELIEEAALRGSAGRLLAIRSLASPLGSDTFVAFATSAPEGTPQPDGEETDGAAFFALDDIEAMYRERQVVRLHRLIAHHVLDGEPQPPVQTLPALDRDGNAATATVYLV
ncbi:MAG TPA: NUDIX domain-containing protein [Dehalococcoidia bacterium]|nr:NUDIX domain-containing protein [Dehalococcoidia bacterium]